MTSYIIDASAWIEYFDGSLKGSKIKHLMEAEDSRLISSTITIAELTSVAQRQGKDYCKVIAKMVSEMSRIEPISFDLAADAGTFHANSRKKGKLSLSDAVLVVLSRSTNSRIISTDSDFSTFKEAIVIN
jgi:predicted nucleic acid-binding protein